MSASVTRYAARVCLALFLPASDVGSAMTFRPLMRNRAMFRAKRASNVAMANPNLRQLTWKQGWADPDIRRLRLTNLMQNWHFQFEFVRSQVYFRS